MTTYNLNQWIQIDNYLVRVEEMKEEIIRIGRRAEQTRTVRFLVAYKNQTQGTLKHTGLQWLLYDAAGYNYDNEIVLAYFGDDAPRKLQEGRTNPGRQVKGWVAFKLPQDAVPDYVQFRADFMTPNTDDISLFAEVEGEETAVSPTPPANFLQKTWQALTPPKYEISLSNLQADHRYVLKKPVIDFYGNQFMPGTKLTYQTSYPPHHGLHIIIFTEATLYLHKDDHADIFTNTERFIGKVPYPLSSPTLTGSSNTSIPNFLGLPAIRWKKPLVKPRLSLNPGQPPRKSMFTSGKQSARDTNGAVNFIIGAKTGPTIGN